MAHGLKLGAHAVDDRAVRRVGDEHFGAAIPQDEGDFRPGQAEIQREATRVRIDSQRIARDVTREVNRTRVEGDWPNSLRLVERDSKSFTVSGMPTLSLQTFDGYVAVHAWDKQEVQLTISKRAATEQQMRGINVRADQNGSDINVVADFDKNFSAQAGNIYSTNAMVSFDVYVPRNANVRPGPTLRIAK